MATTKTVTKLGLDRFAQIIGMNPLHFNGVNLSNGQFVTCGSPIFQYSWQKADRMSREEISQAIANAERTIEDGLFYRLMPTYEEDERHPLDPRLWQPRFRTDWGYVLSGGRRAKAVIEAGAVITWGSADDIGYKRYGTVTVSTTAQYADEVVVYYPGHMGDDEWIIKPRGVTLVGSGATITLNRERCVLEETLESYRDAFTVEGTDDAQFLGTVDVGRVYLDPADPMAFLWSKGCLCGCNPCVHATQGGCLTVVDQRQGVVLTQPATYNVTTGLFTQAVFNPCTRPDAARLWYRGGSLYNPNDYTVMDPDIERAVAYLALSMLKRPICNCNVIMDATNYWGLDLNEITRESSFSQRPQRIGNINNPFGSTRGALNAYRLVQQRTIGQPVLI